jgi:hypothetical protein
VYENCIFKYANEKSARDFFERNGISDNDWTSKNLISFIFINFINI